MPPGSTKQNNVESAPAKPSLQEVTKTYWSIKEKQDLIRRRRQLSSFQSDSNWMLSAAQELKDLDAQAADIEAYAKARGWWTELQAAKPRATVHRPSASTSWSSPSRSSVSRVANVTYGNGTTSYTSGRSWQEKDQDAKYVPKKRKETPATGGRQWESELQHTRALGSIMSEYSNYDADNFRDSHHSPGGRRTITKLGWAGLALAFETVGIGLSRRVLAGDIPFDFLPKSRGDWDDDDWDLRSDDE